MLLLGLSRFGGNLLKTFIPNNNSRKHSGFTLAEVLITLGIIGVVAAMTLPTLIQSYKKQVVETKLAKFYSVMNNAIRMAEVEYGEQSTWTDYYETDEIDEDGNTLYSKGDKYDAHVKKYFAPYLKITKAEDITDVLKGNSPKRVYYLADGTAFGFNLHENREIIFYTDKPKKCLQKSSALGSCYFIFAFIPDGSFNWDTYKYNSNNGMQPSLYQWDGKEDSLMTDSIHGCKNGDGTYCTKLIQINGWKIPDDYPRKF